MSRVRLRLAALLVLVPVLPIALRLINLQVLTHPRLKRMASDQFMRHSVLPRPRGAVLARCGTPLAQSVPAWSCYIEPERVRQTPERLGARLGPALRMAPGDIASRARSRAKFIWVKRKLDYAAAQDVSRLSLEGVGLAPEYSRHYPGALARSVVGSVDLDGRGLSGVELSMDSELQQEPERLTVIRDARGRRVLRLKSPDPVRRSEVRLSIDRSIQYYAEASLARAVSRHRAAGGMLVVQDPATGEILALASHPGHPLRNPPVQDLFEPGSTFKIVAAAAALDNRRVRASERFSGEGGRWEPAPGLIIRDHEPRPTYDLQDTLAHSSNIGIAKIAQRLKARELYAQARSFGFGQKPGTSLPAESPGILELRDLERGSALLPASYGYGVGVTALQLAGAYCALANGGLLMEPLLVLESSRADKVRSRPPRVIRRALSETAARDLLRILQTAVESGTGKAAQLPGYSVAGKTGTARKFDKASSAYSTDRYISSFVGIVPASHPRFVLIIVIDSPRGLYYGSDVAAPVFAETARRILALKGVEPDVPWVARSK